MKRIPTVLADINKFMKFTMKAESLLRNEALAAVPVPTVSSIPQLSGIVVEADEKSVTLTGSDSSFFVQKQIKPSDENGLIIEEPGSFIIEGLFFTNILKHAEAEMITFEKNMGSNLVSISCGKSSFNLNTFTDYVPYDLTEIKTGTKFKMNSTDIRDSIKLAAAFISKNDKGRPVLTGIHVSVDETQTTFEGTDGYSMGKSTKESEIIQTGTHPDIVLPRRVSNMVHRTLPQNCEVLCGFNSNKIQFRYEDEDGQGIVQSGLLAGTFPDISRVGPQNPTKRLVVDMNGFKEIFGRVAVIDDPDKVIAVHIRAGQDTLTLSSEDADVGRIIQTVNRELYDYEGDSMDVYVNIKYVKVALSKILDEKIEILTDDTQRMIQMHGANDQSTSVVLVTLKKY